MFSSSPLSASLTVFTSYFYRKSIIALAVQLTDDLIRRHNGGERIADISKDAVYLAIIMMQGSLKTSGSGYVTTTLMQLAGCSDDQAWWGGFIASTAVCLALDATPTGVLVTIVSTIGGEIGKDTVNNLYPQCRPS